MVKQKKPNYVSYEDWLKLDELETAVGEAQGRPRIKFTKVADMLAALGKQ
jgi:ferredoxin--NADP+ reductase